MLQQMLTNHTKLSVSALSAGMNTVVRELHLVITVTVEKRRSLLQTPGSSHIPVDRCVSESLNPRVDIAACFFVTQVHLIWGQYAHLMCSAVWCCKDKNTWKKCFCVKWITYRWVSEIIKIFLRCHQFFFFCLCVCVSGPCPPCPKMVSVSCLCGKSSRVPRRCSAKSWSCRQICGQTLPCRIHSCTDMCHAGQCSNSKCECT